MKRGREIDTANYLMFPSQATKAESLISSHDSDTGRVFECMTCNKQFPSFQALGGHRASHKKPKSIDGKVETSKTNESPTKAKSHECSICGLEFAIGQALGGHMRRHRGEALNDHEHAQEDSTLRSSAPAALRKNISTKRIWLDLNLMPLENDLEFLKLGKVAHSAPLVHCFF